MRSLARFLIDQVVPAGLVAALIVLQRLGLVTLLPLSSVIEGEYGNYALVLGTAAALVASGTFTRLNREYTLGGFLLTVVAGLISVTPFIVARYGISLGLTSTYFSILATFAYLAFAVVIGLLFGGCWSVVVKALRDHGPSF